MATAFADKHPMIICESFEKIPPLSTPIGLSIGTFDGVHLGHQALFHFLRQKVGPKGTVAALTFTNHPAQFFKQLPPRLLCTHKHKLKLLQQLGVNLVMLREFNAEFAAQPFDLFLQELKTSLPFSYLALGEDASFGKNRQGSPEAIRRLAPGLDFEVDYLPKTLSEGQPISSGRIRSALEQGNLDEVATLLGRPYSIMASVDGGSIDASHLCLPPDGTYPVRMNGVKGEATVSNPTKTVCLSGGGNGEVEIIF